MKNIQMKKICLLVMLGFFLFIPTTLKAQDISVVAENPDVLTIDVRVYDVKEKQTVNTAIPFAYYAVFFRGFPGSIYYRNALVGTDESFVASHPYYFKNMEDGRFNTFITNARLVEYNKKSKPKMGIVRLTINMHALISDLEQQGVKRRFGL